MIQFNSYFLFCILLTPSVSNSKPDSNASFFGRRRQLLWSPFQFTKQQQCDSPSPFFSGAIFPRKKNKGWKLSSSVDDQDMDFNSHIFDPLEILSPELIQEFRGLTTTTTTRNPQISTYPKNNFGSDWSLPKAPSTPPNRGNHKASESNNGKSGLLLGSIAAILKNPMAIAKWGLTGLQIGIVLYLGHAVWQAAQDMLTELDDQSKTNSGRSIFKPRVVTEVLEAIDAQEPPQTAHGSLFRIAQRLHTVTGWQLFDEDQNHPSLQRLLLSLSKDEYSILEQCLHIPAPGVEDNPSEQWNNLYGISDIQQSIVDRLHAMKFSTDHNPYASILVNNNAGLLLYGPPGCGKTKLLQAVCNTVRTPSFIVTPSVLLRKYVGETNGLVRSLFQLAQKLGGCVICLDELDGLFRERRHDEHESSRELKTEFMQWWDGLKNDASNILIVGATNRPFDIDSAILRRMSQSHFVGLPMRTAREQILQGILSKVPTSPSIHISELADMTEGFSPSDLTQLVRMAAQLGPLREGRGNQNSNLYRPLTQHDFRQARQYIGPTPLSSSYRSALIQFHHQQQQQHDTPSHQQQQQFSPPLPNFSSQEKKHSSRMLQSTPWGDFFHAGTISVHELDSSLDSDTTTTSTTLLDLEREQEIHEEEDDDEIQDETTTEATYYTEDDHFKE